MQDVTEAVRKRAALFGYTNVFEKYIFIPKIHYFI